MKPVGVILAGGLARRMGGGQKALLELGRRPLVAHAIARLTPQVAALALNVNAEMAAYERFGLPLVADTVPGFAGPLAGILAGMDWAAGAHPEGSLLLSAPTDAPFLPDDMAARLGAALTDEAAAVAVCASGGRHHPVAALWRMDLRESLREALTARDIRKIDRFTAEHRVALVEWPATPSDPFFNVNRPEDLTRAEALLG
ncbi:molybdenum cofactor guanylyltransferase MobA [Minwuia thermotolerans]|nr:molybdenum cofactor guanylyltransferase MobA [Minwuia thermotolerans]